MPTMPKLSDVFCQIRGLEIVHQVEAHEFRAAKGDGAIAEEVAINLEAVEHHTAQHRPRIVLVEMTEHLIDIFAQMVGHHHLGEESKEDETHAFGDVVVIESLLLMQLSQQIARTLDGTRDQLWEKHHIERVIAEMPLRLLVPTIHLKHIAHALESME